MNTILSKLGATSLVMTGALTLGPVAFSASPIFLAASANTNVTDKGACTFDGTWADKSGGLMKLGVDDNDDVTGSYDDGKGRLLGVVDKQDKDQKVYGDFRRTTGRRFTGDFVLVLDAACDSFTGAWRYHGQDEWHPGWDHKRVSSGDHQPGGAAAKPGCDFVGEWGREPKNPDLTVTRDGEKLTGNWGDRLLVHDGVATDGDRQVWTGTVTAKKTGNRLGSFSIRLGPAPGCDAMDVKFSGADGTQQDEQLSRI